MLRRWELGGSMGWRELGGSRLRMWKLYRSRLQCNELVGTKLGGREFGGSALGWRALVGTTGWDGGGMTAPDCRARHSFRWPDVSPGSRGLKEPVGSRLRRRKLYVFRPGWREGFRLLQAWTEGTW